MEFTFVITKKRIMAHFPTIFCWLNVLVGLYFVRESLQEFEPKAAYIFFGWSGLFFLVWLASALRDTIKNKRTARQNMANQR